MHVTYINRDKRRGNFSFERIFSAVQNNLEKEIEIENYFLPDIRKKWKGIREVSKLKADIFHITGDVNFLAFGLSTDKLVITVHDVGFLENLQNNYLKQSVYKYFWFNYPLKKASAITTVSEFTKSKLIKYFRIPEKKITVIPNPVFMELGKKEVAFNEQKPVILQIGTGPHKNLNGLIEAVKKMKVKLSIVGNPSEADRMLLKRYGIEHEISFNISDEELKAKYLAADILYFASYHEGFGVPIIEANQVGIPVITSNRSPMPWVAGKAALLVDPGNHEEIRKSIYDLVHDTAMREDLINIGFENVKRFDSAIIAKQYHKVYEKVYNKLQV